MATGVNPTPEMTAAVLGGDLDEVLRLVEDLHSAADWSGLAAIEDMCRRAHERGLTLWPAAVRARYLRALDGTPRWSATTLDGSALAQFGLGPLTEVVAQGHTWTELAPHLPAGPEAGVAAQERVLRGEDLSSDPEARGLHGELPLSLGAWEPAYHLPRYRPDSVDVAAPPGMAATAVIDCGEAGEEVDDPEGMDALRDLVAPWVEQSGGRARVVSTRGELEGALGVLGVGTARVTELTPAEAMAHMAWAAASGGLHGRRRGGAYGRFAAWWTAATLGGLLDLWPLDVDEAGESVAELRWFAWDRGADRQGWHLALAAVDPRRHLAWALEAVDAGDPTGEGQSPRVG